MKDKLVQIVLSRKILTYASGSNTKLDLVFYLLCILQICIIPSIPTGFHSANPDGWLGFSITVIFSFVFYPIFYFAFYRIKNSQFLREVIVFSVVARFTSFVLTGILALVQIGFWKYMQLNNIPNTSLVYYLIYYGIFSALMVSYKNRLESFAVK
jgi:hypothetical protein